MDDSFDGTLSSFLEIAKRLRRAGVPHFTSTVTRSALEIPASFVRDHGEDMKSSASLRLGSGSKVWPVQIQVCYSVRFRVRFSQLWKEFLSDNGLKRGDELIVSLVAVSEFVVYTLKRTNIDSQRLSRNSSSPITLGRDKFKNQIAETKRHAEIPDNSFNGAIFFRKQMSEASIGHFGHPQLARIEIPADFVRRHRRLLSEGTLITLEGPMPGTISQVVCCHEPTNRRIMWRQGWPSFVRRNELRKGVNLEFRLTAPSRFSVLLRMQDSSIQDPSSPIRSANVFHKDRDSTAQGGEGSNARPTKSPNPSAAVDPHGNPHFIKTLPATSVPSLTAYPFLVVPSSFRNLVRLPPNVNLQGPNSDEIFPVKYSGVVKKCTTKNFARGWKDYANCNGLEAGDKLRFAYKSELHLFVVDYV